MIRIKNEKIHLFNCSISHIESNITLNDLENIFQTESKSDNYICNSHDGKLYIKYY